MDNKIVTARFATDDNYANVYDVYQWDYGQVLRIEGLKLPNMVEIHFSLQETSGEAKTRIGVTKDGVTDVVIPDSFLENEGIGDNYKIFVWVYVADKNSGSTEYKITIHIKARAKPEITHGGQDGEVFQEAVEAVRGAAKRAAESEKQAERWAVGRVDVPGAETDNSKFYAEESKKNAQQTTKDKEAVEELVKKTENIGQLAEEVKANAQKASESVKNAETSATNASASEKNAKTSESNASTSETNAKASETNAKASEQAVEESKQAVDKAVADFGQAVTDASATLKAEKDAHVKAITTTGTTETKKVTDEGAKQVQTVQSIGTQETEKVTAEGTKQVGLVKTEGEKHLASVQTAAQEIIADREQITKNKTDIADLRQKKADAIVESVSGTLLNVKDSSGAFFEDFSMSGKTTQDGTPTPDTPVEIVNAGRLNSDTGKYEVDVKITGKNLFDMNKFIDTCNFTKNEDGTFRIDKFVKRYDCFMPANTILSIEVLKVEDSSGAAVLELFYEDGKNTYIGFNQVGVKTFLIQKDVAYIKVLAYRNHEYKYIQLEKGTVATPYEPYKEQILTLTSDRPMTKWDRLVKQEGQIGWLYNSAEILLNGTENWIRHSEINKETTQAFGLSIPDLIYGEDAAIGQNGLTDKFRYVNAAWAKDEAGQAINNGRLFINIEKTKASTVEEFKAWLKSNNVKVVYKTKQTEFVPLPKEEQEAIRALSTYYHTTVVSNSEDMEMELSYVADTKNYTDRKIEQAVSAQTQNLANLLSLMPLSTQAAMIEADTNNILDMEVQK